VGQSAQHHQQIETTRLFLPFTFIPQHAQSQTCFFSSPKREDTGFPRHFKAPTWGNFSYSTRGYSIHTAICSAACCAGAKEIQRTCPQRLPPDITSTLTTPRRYTSHRRRRRDYRWQRACAIKSIRTTTVTRRTRPKRWHTMAGGVQMSRNTLRT
jgi:hypothetical protein